MKLLLVDDDAFLRDMYATKFGESGYDVHIAETAHQALTLIKHTPDFEVILLDMIMPGMTGIELIKEIQVSFPAMKASCIVLSNQAKGIVFQFECNQLALSVQYKAIDLSLQG